MSKKEWNNQQDEKTSRNIATGLTIAAAASVLLFGIVGGMICLAGGWAVYAICKSRLPLAAKIILGIAAGLAALAFLVMFVLMSAVAVSE